MHCENDYAESSFVFRDFLFTKKPGGMTYKYDDQHLSGLEKQVKERKAQMVQAFKMLQKGDQYVTSEGEVIPAASGTSTASSLSIKIVDNA